MPSPETTHECFRLLNEQLAKHNAELATERGMNFRTGKMSPPELPIPLRKVDSKKRKRMPVLLCAYCPICGKSLREKTGACDASS